jgi:ectoine hydroxylase-related dioxygenase (phytanoyl-CoA dioxygenase family)
LLFQACTVHGARGNASLVRPRRAIATRWCGDEVVYAPVEGQILYPRDPGLESGAPLSGEMFPRVLPELNQADVAARMRGPLYPDPNLIPRMQEQIGRAERVAV